MEAPDAPERLLCDTSFVAHAGIRRVRPERYEHWGEQIVARIEAAILAISVITLGEARFGYRNADWGRGRIAEEERRLSSFLHIPLDFPDLEEWGRLRDLAKRAGNAISDNDLWIAATASTRRYPLLTCDRDQQRLERDLPVDVIYLPPRPAARNP
jgi:predicted nucleic acid-binding protein